MGAWDIRTLQNDEALDAMWQISKKPATLDTIRKALSDESIDVKLIGISMVTTAIENEVDEKTFGSLYDYEDFFAQFKDIELDATIVDTALDTLEYVKKYDYNWFGESAIERDNFLDRLRKILKSYKD